MNEKRTLSETQRRTLAAVADSLGKHALPPARFNAEAIEELQVMGLVATGTKPERFVLTTAGAKEVRRLRLLTNPVALLTCETFAHRGPRVSFSLRYFGANGNQVFSAKFKTKDAALLAAGSHGGKVTLGEWAAIVEEVTLMTPTWAFEVPVAYRTLATFGSPAVLEKALAEDFA